MSSVVNKLFIIIAVMERFVFILVLFLVSPSHGTKSLPLCEDVQSDKKIVCSKVKDYDHQQVPSLPTNIKIEISPNGIQEIDEKAQTITFQASISLTWVDDRLTFNGRRENGTDFLLMNHLKNVLWVPDMLFPNTVHIEKAGGFKGKHLQVLYFVAFNGAQWITFTDVFVIKLDCKMSFNHFPFDDQKCEWLIRSYASTSNEVLLQSPILWIPREYGYDYAQSLVNESLNVISSGLAFDVRVKPLDSIIRSLPYNTKFSFAKVEFHLQRKSEELNKLLISYFCPSGAFAILSLFSFFVKPEVVSYTLDNIKQNLNELFFKVPGRMGMLVTIFLVVIANYGSIEAPSSRGFSYIELWSIGVQIPILFAILVYGILLAVIKYKGAKTEVKYLKEGTTYGDTFKTIDLVAFFFSFTFIIIFNIVYLILCAKA